MSRLFRVYRKHANETLVKLITLYQHYIAQYIRRFLWQLYTVLMVVVCYTLCYTEGRPLALAEDHNGGRLRLKTFKALNGLLCADVPLRNYSLTHFG